MFLEIFWIKHMVQEKHEEHSNTRHKMMVLKKKLADSGAKKVSGLNVMWLNHGWNLLQKLFFCCNYFANLPQFYVI